MHRRELLLKDMGKALYEFITVYDNANWYGKRPGISRPWPKGVWAASCGAFREWAIHAHDGKVCYSVDGYRQRNGDGSGHVGILVGEGKLRFPHDDSRTMHSLSMWVEGSGKIVGVTNEPDVNWEPAVEAMLLALLEVTPRLHAAIAEYDADKERERQTLRRSELDAAKAAIS